MPLDLPVRSLHQDGPTGVAPCVAIAAGGTRRSLPASMAGTLMPAGPVWPVPFATSVLEGLCRHGDGLVPRIDWHHRCGGAAGTAPWSLLVHTARGPVALRVDGMALEPDEATAPSGAREEIEALLSTLVPAAAPAALPPAAEPAGGGDGIDLLLVRCGGRSVALPARPVERVARHGGVFRRREGAEECLVDIDGRLLAGGPLADRLEGGSDPEPQPWAVIVRDGGRRVALTVASVEGLLRAPAAELQRVAHRHGSTHHWWNAGRGLIDIVDPFGAGDPLDGIAAQDRGPCAAADGRPGRVAVTAGSFTILLPIRSIHGLADTPAMPGGDRRRGRCPLIDLATMLGRGGRDGSRMIWLNRPGARRPLALLVDGVADDGATWERHPRPALPPAAAALFDAVSCRGAAVAYELRADALPWRPPPDVGALLAAAFRGWIEPPT